jgi:hypothetical protein
VTGRSLALAHHTVEVADVAPRSEDVGRRVGTDLVVGSKLEGRSSHGCNLSPVLVR